MSVRDWEPWDQPVSVSPLVFIEYHKVFVFSTLNFVQSHNSLLVHFTEKAIYPLTFQCSRSILDLLGSRRAAIFLRDSPKKEVTLDGSANHSDRQGLLLFDFII